MLFDLLILTAMEKNHNSIGTHRLSSSVSSKLSDHPHWIGRKREKNVKEKKAGGESFFFAGDSFYPRTTGKYIPECEPRELSKSHPSEVRPGMGFGQGGDAPSRAHTHSTAYP